MDDPRYLPASWIRAKVSGTEIQIIGQIVGATNDGDGWKYLVSNPLNEQQPYSVHEEDIIGYALRLR